MAWIDGLINANMCMYTGAAFQIGKLLKRLAFSDKTAE